MVLVFFGGFLLDESAAATDPAWECEGKGACELKQRRFADKIMPHILNL